MTSRHLLATGLAAVAVLAACSSPPTAPETDSAAGEATTDASQAAASGTGESGASSEAASPEEAAGDLRALPVLEELYPQLEGMSVEERREFLIPLAEEAGGEVNAYGSMNGEEGPAMVDAFEDATGLSVAFYRASASTILERVLQEHDAGFQGSDVVFVNGTEMVALQREGLLAPLETPATADLPEEGVTPEWAWTYVNAMAPLWNTNAITGDRVPETWEQVLTEYDGELVLELGDFDWFATLVGYLQEEGGMTEEEAVALFRDAASGASVADGHTLMAELVAAGEHSIAASAYDLNGRQLAAEGAPVAYEPPVEPLIVRPNGIGVYADAPNPAGALLWIDFMLTEGQEIIAEYERTPASQAVEGGLPEEYEILPVSLEEVFDERDKWSTLYEEIVQGAAPAG